MAPKSKTPEGELTAPELRKLIRAHNILSKIVIPKGTDRQGLIKLIEGKNYKVDHDKKVIRPKQQRGKQITLKKAEELTKPKPVSEEVKKKRAEKKKEQEEAKQKDIKIAKKEAVQEFKKKKKEAEKLNKKKDLKIKSILINKKDMGETQFIKNQKKLQLEKQKETRRALLKQNVKVDKTTRRGKPVKKKELSKEEKIKQLEQSIAQKKKDVEIMKKKNEEKNKKLSTEEKKKKIKQLEEQVKKKEEALKKKEEKKEEPKKDNNPLFVVGQTYGTEEDAFKDDDNSTKKNKIVIKVIKRTKKFITFTRGDDDEPMKRSIQYDEGDGEYLPYPFKINAKRDLIKPKEKKEVKKEVKKDNVLDSNSFKASNLNANDLVKLIDSLGLDYRFNRGRLMIGTYRDFLQGVVSGGDFDTSRLKPVISIEEREKLPEHIRLLYSYSYENKNKDTEYKLLNKTSKKELVMKIKKFFDK